MPSFAIAVLLWVPWILLRLFGVAGSPDFAFAALMSDLGAVLGGAVMVLLPLIIIAGTRRPFPVLTLSASGLRSLIEVPWNVVGSSQVRAWFGIPILTVDLVGDSAFKKRLPSFLKLRYAIHKRAFGAPLVFGELRGVTLEDVKCILDEYRHVAGSENQQGKEGVGEPTAD